MNNKREYYYRVLGLKPGATPDEVKSAYRSLLKIYHPDRNNSPSAQSIYDEINIAYKALLDQSAVGETDINSVINRNYSKETTQTSNDSSKRTQQSNANSSQETSQASSYGSERTKQSNANNSSSFKQQSSWMLEELKRNYESKIPFELQNLPSIFLCSLSEFFAAYKISFSKVYYYAMLFILMCLLNSGIFKHNMPIGILLVSFYIISLVLFTFFRYYFKPSAWPNYQRIAAAIAYGAILPLLVACFSLFTVGMRDLAIIWLYAAFPVWVLMIP